MATLSRLSASRGERTERATAYGDARDKAAATHADGTGAAFVGPSRGRSSQDLPSPFGLVRSEAAAAAGRELGAAFEMLDRATACFELLSQKLTQVEAERDEAILQLEEHGRAAAKWEQLIEATKNRCATAERDLAKMTEDRALQSERAEVAEERGAQLETSLRATERRLDDFVGQYGKLHDQVMSTFGVGSLTYRAMDILSEQGRRKAA